MVDDRFYPSEQILIHEFGHTGFHCTTVCLTGYVHSLCAVWHAGCTTLAVGSIALGLHRIAVPARSHGRWDAGGPAGRYLCSIQSCNQAEAV